MIAALRALESNKSPRAWLQVVALYPQISEPSHLAFIKALRRTDAVKHALTMLTSEASESDLLAALLVTRVMKPKQVPLQQALVHPSVRVRREALVVATVLPTAKAPLYPLLDDPDSVVRSFAVSALRKQGLDAPTLTRLRERLTLEEDDVVRDDLEAAIGD